VAVTAVAAKTDGEEEEEDEEEPRGEEARRWVDTGDTGELALELFTCSSGRARFALVSNAGHVTPGVAYPKAALRSVCDDDERWSAV
jgi:hypothetical protein